ncbi:YihY/virulence factor BrkB family protein [Rubrivirga sp.]|uniref:YihY/virulence factor BrkB family protein n=1 Tax=Rubrivirga sp. TaxID=1885344 RepID=UPI003B51F2F6
MTLSWPLVKSLAVTTAKEVTDDDVPSLAAAIAYYTVFSLPPLLVLLVAIAGAVFGPDEVTRVLTEQAGAAVGGGAADAVRGMIENASTMGTGIGAKLAGIAALLFGATGAFAELQKALNRAWEVEAASEGGGLVSLVLKRVLSFGMVLTIAFLLLVSLVLSAVLAALGDAAASVAGDGVAGTLVQILNLVVGFGVTAALFAVLFRTLPDAEISWRDVAVGALVTALLFTIGKAAIGLYLGTADPGSAFGAAGSLALLLVWIYYSALIVLVGAEFTQAWAEQVGAGIEPEEPGDDTPTPTVGDADSDVHPTALPRDPAPY